MAYIKKLFRNQREKAEYVRHLVDLSAMPDNERKRWEKIVPHMSNEELDHFGEMLEKQISELADMYLKIMQRKAESRSFSVDTEYSADAITKSFNDISHFFETLPMVNESELEVVENPEERIKEMNVLQHLVQSAYFINSKNKELLIENVKNLPLLIIRDLQGVVIREGLRNLQKKHFVSSSSVHA